MPPTIFKPRHGATSYSPACKRRVESDAKVPTIFKPRHGATSYSPACQRRVESRDAQKFPTFKPRTGRHHIARRVNAGWRHGMLNKSPHRFSSPGNGRHHIARRVNAGLATRTQRPTPEQAPPGATSYSPACQRRVTRCPNTATDFEPRKGRHRIARRVNAGCSRRMPNRPPRCSSLGTRRHRIARRVNAV